jgi:L-cysteine/cystine lyase
MMTDAGKIARIRMAMPVTGKSIYLNTGAVGPLANVTVEVMSQAIEFEHEVGRASPGAWGGKAEAKTNLRAAFARLAHAPVETIALTYHTTNGVNIVAHGLDWQAGDEIITTNLEHPGGLIPLYILQQRRGVKVKVVHITAEDSSDDIVARFEAALSPRTRLMAFSHVAWNLGIRLPLEAIVALGHRHGVFSLVDGAQSAGAIPLDLPASGVDFYAMPGQKWLCGPEGIGALYVRSDRLPELAQTFVGYASLNEGQYDYAGHFTPGAGAQRYEMGTVNVPNIKAMVANLAWLENWVGWNWVHARTAQLADYTREALTGLPGVTLVTPPGQHAGLTSFTLEGHDPEPVCAQLAESGIVLRTIKDPACLRISTGFFNTEGEIDRLVAGLETIIQAER